MPVKEINSNAWILIILIPDIDYNVAMTFILNNNNNNSNNNHWRTACTVGAAATATRPDQP